MNRPDPLERAGGQISAASVDSGEPVPLPTLAELRRELGEPEARWVEDLAATVRALREEVR